MSRKDYIALARVIRDFYDNAETEDQKYIIRQMAYSMCSVFKADNYRFDRDRFIYAALGQ